MLIQIQLSISHRKIIIIIIDDNTIRYLCNELIVEIATAIVIISSKGSTL